LGKPRERTPGVLDFGLQRGVGVVDETAVIRPQMRVEDVRARGQGLSRRERAGVCKRLRALHTLEIMAVNIYKCQISGNACALDTALTAAMCNEMTHMQDFQTKLYEYGFTPSKLRFGYWGMGYVFGLGSRLLGRERVLRTGVWAEKKAVGHYGRLLSEVDWEDEPRAVIERDRADEYRHIAMWEQFLANPEKTCPSR
jgi:demethoxyubiquinone hydroxylase (CLK1/Coq7/Cat5 family)